MPRWVRAVKSPHPICRRCKHPHPTADACIGAPDDWTPPATEQEAAERECELLIREYGVDKARERESA